MDDYVDFDPYWDYQEDLEDYFYAPWTFSEEYATIEEEEEDVELDSGWGLGEASE